eukprot:403347199
MKFYNRQQQLKQIALKKVKYPSLKKKDFPQFILNKVSHLQEILFKNHISRLVACKYYYENLSKRALQMKISNNQKPFLQPIYTSSLKLEAQQRKVLKLKVKSFERKLILLRQHKIKKNTYFRMMINRASLLYPHLSLHQIYDTFFHYAKAFILSPFYVFRFLRSMPMFKGLEKYNFISKIAGNMMYYGRITGLKLKYFWDTLNHYLLLMYIIRTLWSQKLLTLIGLTLLSYTFYFRQLYFINHKTQKLYLQDLVSSYDQQLKTQLKAQINQNVFANDELPKKVGPILFDLVQMPNIKILMTDLFIKLLHNPAFVQDTKKLVADIIHDYLNSKHCEDSFKKIIIEQVLKNEETIRPNMYRLLKNYLLHENKESLIEMAEGILIQVLQINGVERTVIDNIMRETGNSLENKAVFNAAVKAALSSMQPDINTKK